MRSLLAFALVVVSASSEARPPEKKTSARISVANVRPTLPMVELGAPEELEIRSINQPEHLNAKPPPRAPQIRPPRAPPTRERSAMKRALSASRRGVERVVRQ
jgi:hypothetical protein